MSEVSSILEMFSYIYFFSNSKNSCSVVVWFPRCENMTRCTLSVFYYLFHRDLLSCWFWQYGCQPEPLIQPQPSSCPADLCSRQRHLRAITGHHSPRLSSLSRGAVAANWILLGAKAFPIDVLMFLGVSKLLSVGRGGFHRVKISAGYSNCSCHNSDVNRFHAEALYLNMST